MKGFAFRLTEETREVIFDKDFAEAYKNSETDFTRKRRMGFIGIMALSLNFLRKSLQLEIDNYMELLDPEIEKPITKQAFSKARQKIDWGAFEYLFEMTGEKAIEADVFGRYKGYRVFAIDGTELYLPLSKEIVDDYKLYRRTHIPHGRASVLCDVMTGYSIHAAITPLAVGERKLALEHLDYFSDLKGKKDIILFDRGYVSYELIKRLIDDGCKYVMRMKTRFNKEIDNTNKDDFFITLDINREAYKIRVIKLVLENGETEVLITNLSRTAFKHTDFAELYHLRWGIETKFNTLKNKLDIESFSGKTINTVLQDFYATLYLSNIVAAIKSESDEIIKENNASKNLKYNYVTNENLLIGKLKDNLVLLLLNDNPDFRSQLLDKLIERVSHFRTEIKPNRHFERRDASHKKVRCKIKKVL